MKITVESHIDIPQCIKEVNNPQLQTFAATDWHRLITPFTPMDSGSLYQNVTIRPNEIEYNSPYAHRVYNGDNMDFKTEYHAKASAHWDMVAKPTQETALISDLQKFVDR